MKINKNHKVKGKKIMNKARYTMTIGYIVEKYDIFDFDYTPVGVSKERLEKAFIDYYAYREIAFETYEQWKLKFTLLWQEMILKYNTLFSKIVDAYTTYKSTTTSVTNTQGKNKSENKHIPTPITNQVSDEAVPSAFTLGEGESEATGEMESVNKKQTKSDVEMIGEYIKTYQTVIIMFLKEFNKLMFKRY